MFKERPFVKYWNHEYDANRKTPTICYSDRVCEDLFRDADNATCPCDVCNQQFACSTCDPTCPTYQVWCAGIDGNEDMFDSLVLV